MAPTPHAGAAPLREGEGKRALITGLTGFTGGYLARELRDAGYQVLGSAMSNGHASSGSINVDLTDRDAVQQMIDEAQPDVVAHLAAIAYVAHTDPAQFYRVNIVGTRNLLEALAGRRRTPSAVLLASSANVYGNACGGVIDERVPPAPANEYAVSKLAMEHMARLWSGKLPIQIARPFNYSGNAKLHDAIGSIEPIALADTLRWMYQA